MKVYIIFDPAGIWELGEAVFERWEDASLQATSYTQEHSRSWYPGYYLEVRTFEVVPAPEPARG